METDKQTENRPWLWKKGQSGNLKGRPKGKTMKEYAKEYLSCLTDDERDAFMDGLSKEVIWKMAEGNPANATDITSAGKPILQVSEAMLNKHGLTPNTDTSSEMPQQI